MKMIKFTRKSVIVAGVAVLVIALMLECLMHHSWLRRQYYRYQVKTSLSKQIKALDDPLSQMGFDFDTKHIAAGCVQGTEQPTASQSVLQCTATIESYQIIGNDPAKLASLNKQAASLSQLLTTNGWKQREDLPTIGWFENISKGVDYQPDQLNHKQIGDMTCTIDFFTAFSKPSPIAIRLEAICYKPRLTEFDTI